MTLPFTLLLDPAEPATMFPPPVQMLVAGNTIQKKTRKAVETITRHGHGYGLQLDTNDEIHSFRALDRETLRWGIRDRNGQPMLCQRHQFIGSEGYEYQPGVINTSTGPNTDRLRNDGTRSRYNCIPENEHDPIGWSNSFGDGSGSTVMMATIVEIPDWVTANDLCAAVLGCHATDGGPASPFTIMVGQGQMRVVLRNQRTPIRAGDRAPRGEEFTVDIGAGDIGQKWVVVVDALFDPIVGHFRCWVNKGDKWVKVAERLNGWGWGYATGDPDGRVWGAILDGAYWWHNAGSDVATFNWDDRFPTRELWYGPSALFVDEDVTAPAVGEWIMSRLLAPPPDNPPPDPPDNPPPDTGIDERVAAIEDEYASMSAEVAALRAEVADLTSSTRAQLEALDAEIANQLAAWSALAALARGVVEDG